MRCVALSHSFALLAVVVISSAERDLYLNTDCPEGWREESYEFGNKCYKEIEAPRSLEHCKISEWCYSTHPASVPVRPRSESEIIRLRKIIDDEERVTEWKKAVLIGLHPTCNGERNDGELLTFYIDSASGVEQFAFTSSEYWDIEKYNKSAPENLIGFSVNKKLNDLPEDFRGGTPTVMCELELAVEVNEDKTCKPGFLIYPKDTKLCLSPYVYAPLVTSTTESTTTPETTTEEYLYTDTATETCISTMFLFAVMFILA